jgi:uncharacterized protein YjiS (DUF1127 family)
MATQAITSKHLEALGGRGYPCVEPKLPLLLAVLRRVASWYRQQRRYRETVAELSRLSDHVLADIGIGRHQIAEIARASSRRVA